MPDIKNQFTGGKMNKDLDERLVPKGEYRHAMNIQVSTSEESDVGALQNILGNVPGCSYNDPGGIVNQNPIPSGSTTVSSISDEKNDSLYWLVAGPDATNYDITTLTPGTSASGAIVPTTISFKDLIMRTNSDTSIAQSGCEPVFVDLYKFCTTIEPNSVSNLTNQFQLHNPTITHNSIIPGMNVTGFANGVPQFGAVVRSMGGINTGTATYTSGSFTIPPTPGMTQGVAASSLLRVRTFDTSMSGSGVYDSIIISSSATNTIPITSDPAWALYQQHGVIFQYIWTITPTTLTMPTAIQLNATCQTPFGSDGEIVDIAYNQTIEEQPGIGPLINCNIITVVPTNLSTFYLLPTAVSNGDLTPTGIAGSQMDYYPSGNSANLNFTAPPIPNPTVPDNTINITPASASNSFLDEIYNILFEYQGSGVSVPTGAELQIDPFYGAGNLFLPNSCIDPASVVDVNNGFSAGNSGPTTYANVLHIMECGTAQQQTATGTSGIVYSNFPVNASAFNTNGLSLRFVTQTQFGVGSFIFLNKDVEFKDVDALCFDNPERVLNFDKDRLITGINIVDDMLFWTDNFTEPKKINIPRSIEGTEPDGNRHTAIVNTSTGYNLTNYNPVKEEHITVIRKNPKNALELELKTGRDDVSLNYSGVVNTTDGTVQSNIVYSSNNTVIYDFSTLEIGDKVLLEIPQDVLGNTIFDLEWQVGEYVFLKEFDPTGASEPLPLSEFTIRGLIVNSVDNNFSSSTGTVQAEIQIVSVKGTPPSPPSGTTTLSYTIDLENREQVIFEDKLPRFSYRYKYADGEYSTFAPFSDIAFVPSSLNYDAIKGWNKGMINSLRSVVVSGFSPFLFNTSLGQDITEVDILYKEDSSPEVYVVDTLSGLDIPPVGGVLPFNSGSYEIKSETIKNILGSNQLLRVFDNVPRKALAQEVTGSRIVYGNYIQNYDLKVGDKRYKPTFSSYLDTWTQTQEGSPIKSIKSLRDYKLGVVFTDEYGRETPVLISESGGFNVEKINSNKANRLAVKLESAAPQEMAYFKFYIKETSTEYYNLAMDRWYDAEDGNIWLAFPSVDRNKIDIETYLYFKKGSDDTVIENSTKYKVLAIENEAPEFIKTRRVRIGTVTHDSSRILVSGTAPSYSYVFGNSTAPLDEAPRVNGISFSVNYEDIFTSTSLSNLEDIQEDLYIQFVSSTDYSAQYKISEITIDRTVLLADQKYFITLDTNLKEDINFIFDNPNAPTVIQDGVKLQFKKALIENAAKYDGRFFAKIENDGKIKTQITDDSIGVNYIEVANKMVYVLDDDETLKTRSSNTYTDGTDNRILMNHSAYVGSPYTNSNPDGENYNFLAARQTYFGAVRTDVVVPPAVPGVAPLDIITENNGVWFIDRSTKKYTSYTASVDDNDLYWSGAYDMSSFSPSCMEFGSGTAGCTGTAATVHSATWGTGSGITNYSSASNINLAFGGIDQNPTTNGIGSGAFTPPMQKIGGTADEGIWTIGNNEVAKDYFSIGQNTGNYSDGNTNNFVDRLTSGFSFKWKEDPTETVYTIDGQTYYAHNVRFNRQDVFYTSSQNEALDASSSYHKQWRFNVQPSMANWDPAGPVGSTMVNGLNIGASLNILKQVSSTSSFTAGATAIPLDNVDNVEIGMSISTVGTTQTTFLYTTKVTSVDPVNNLIQISPASAGAAASNTVILLGHTIRLVQENIYGLSQTTNVNENYIVVDKIEATCVNNNLKPLYRLQKGMMLTGFNIDTTNVSPGTTIRDNNIIIKEVGEFDSSIGGHRIDLTGYHTPLHFDTTVGATNPSQTLEFTSPSSTLFKVGERLRFEQVTMNGASNFTEDNTFDTFGTNSFSGVGNGESGGIGAVGYTMQMVEPIDEYSDGGNLPPDPFVWETEPKEDVDLNIYYEISENNPMVLNNDTINLAIPVGSRVTNSSGLGGFDVIDPAFTVTHSSENGDEIVINGLGVYIGGLAPGIPAPTPIAAGDTLQITRPNGLVFEVEIAQVFPNVIAGPVPTPGTTANRFRLNPLLHNSNYILNWHNCYSFGNGVESNRIKDVFNAPFINTGVKASTTLLQDYKEEHRKYGLIYSGIYNSMSGINNLNQFIQAEKITKDVNPIYGSIQKLHAGWGQGGDLISICEDRVLKILADKDALFNADGDSNVTATNRVLGQTIPYSGDYGISTNPESFASEAYRAYFTDKVRGAVMRLSMDGLTAISDHGMKDWFRDNLKLSSKLVGSYDDRKDEYNITLTYEDENPYTLSFKENVKGWVSFKSFFPENANSCANEYYTYKEGNLWKHHVEQVDSSTGLEINRNTFYGDFTPSSFKVLINDSPGVIKTFHTINYEGTQSKIDELRNYDTIDVATGVVRDTIYNDEYYNVDAKEGWYVKNIITDLEEGAVPEFIKKEGKWFNYIRGKEGSSVNSTVMTNNIAGGFGNADFSFQGIARATGVDTGLIYGCTDVNAFNYNSLADINQVSATDTSDPCIPVILGCLDSTADDGYFAPIGDPMVDVNTDDGVSCQYYGCQDDGSDPAFPGRPVPYVGAALNYALNANVTPPGYECTYEVYGCTDNGPNINGAGVVNDIDGDGYAASNYDSLATVNATSAIDPTNPCIPHVIGCMDDGTDPSYSSGGVDRPASYSGAAFNYEIANTLDIGNCLYCQYGCTDPAAVNTSPPAIDPYILCDDGSCTYGGCTKPNACNYDPLQTVDDGSCNYCGDTGTNVMNFDGASPSCTANCQYCCDPTILSTTFNPSGTVATISWQPQINAQCVEPEKYTLDLNQIISGVPTYVETKHENHVTGTNTYSKVFSGLNVGEDYTISVKAKCQSGPNIFSGSASSFFTAPVPAPIVIPGCTDPLGCNYNPAATVDDGSCDMDNCNVTALQGAMNYSNTANCDNGCVYCEAPIVSISSLYGTSVIVEVTPAPAPAATTLHYQYVLYPSNSSGYPIGAAIEIANTVTATLYQFTGLTPGNYYAVMVTATCSSFPVVNNAYPSTLANSLSFQAVSSGVCTAPGATNWAWTLNQWGNPVGTGGVPGAVCIFEGCTDPNAVNYNFDNQFPTGSAVASYPNGTFNTTGNSTLFSYGNNVAGPQVTQDGDPYMYSGSPTSLPGTAVDNGTCCYVDGCMDPNASNYDSTACVQTSSIVCLP